MWTCHSAEQERSGGDCEHSITHRRFYEKVIKVKADVAALLNLFSDVSHRHPMVTCGAVKGAAEGRRSS
jgi:hypothetical protein